MKRLVFCLFFAACDSQTSASIEIDGPMPMSVLDFEATLPGHHVTRSLVKSGEPALQLPVNLLLVLPDVAATVQLSLSGTEEGGRPVTATASFASMPHTQTRLTMTLVGPGDDLAMPLDLAAADFSGEDLASEDSSTTATSDLAGDLQAVPSLNLLAGLPGGSASYDNTGLDARLAVPEQPVLIGTTLYVMEYYSGNLRAIDVTNAQVTTIPMLEGANSYNASGPVGLVSDGNGHLYFANMFDHTIRMLTLATRQVTLVAGAPDMSGSSDSPPRFNAPLGLAFDPNGDLWVSDAGNSTIRKISGGAVTTVAGSPGVQEIKDGSGSGAHFQRLRGLAFYNGELYITDESAIRKLTPSPSPAPVTTVVNGGFVGMSGISPDGAGGFLVVDESFNSVHKVILPGTNMVVIGAAGYQRDSIDGISTNARLDNPRWITLDGAGNAYLSEDAAIRKVTLADFSITTLAGMSGNEDSTDSPRGRLNGPSGIAFDGTDTLYVADYYGNRIRTVSLSNGTVGTLAGNGDYHSADGAGLLASFYSPIAVTVDGAGNAYVSDFQGACIRKIGLADPYPVVTISGQCEHGGLPSPSPVPGLSTQYRNPSGLAFDGDHTLYVADAGNNALRSIDLSTGNYLTRWIAGSGNSAQGDGIGLAADFNSPQGLAWDGAHKLLYVSENGNGLLRKVDLTNPNAPNVTRLVGTPFSSSVTDGSFAQATFGALGGLAFDNGILWAADNSSQLVRRIDLTAQQVSSPIGVLAQPFTKAGPLPAHVHGPWGVVMTPRGLVVTSWDENSVLLTSGLQ